ncbi:unnamed protein product [Echinostoma caproni]|uniref:GPI ethanolamine phosphate transferase 2 n=1 Tax=Echinostoma caproni TaxID=27848 RepID=A0A183AXB3_9TREM|nr:unnamed protein product [Echinostoma caproni]
MHFLLLVLVYYVGLIVFMTGLLPMEDITYKDQIPVQTDPGAVTRFVFMIVDGLRSDLLLSPQHAPSWRKLAAHLDRHAFIRANSYIQPPTVTMPRIKAITSGRVPKFVDVLRNLDTAAMHGDTWLSRLVHQKQWSLEFYGDDTWIKLFPDLFKRFDGTNSFFVNDYYEVDRNVTRHLKDLFQRPSEWNGVILHYLGLDHIGHVEGPRGSSLPSKLSEMDTVADSIITQLNEIKSSKGDSWLFVLTGDHGMSDQGGHGGSSFGEVNTGLLLVSSTPRSDQTVPLTETQQVDLASFMGLVTGAGIPKSSLGLIHPKWFDTFWPEPFDRLRALAKLLRHYALLSGCMSRYSEAQWDELPTIDLTCPSKFITRDEIIFYNTLVKQMELKYIYLHQGGSTSRANYSMSDSKNNPDSHEGQIYQLLRKIQSRALSGAHHLDDMSMVAGALLMWLVSSFLVDCVTLSDEFVLPHTRKHRTEKLTIHQDKMPVLCDC